jgi:hypothetical protein
VPNNIFIGANFMREKLNTPQNKREQFLSNSRKRNKPKFIISGLIILLIAITGIVLFNGGVKDKKNTDYFGDPVLQSRSFIGQFIEMKTVTPIVEETKIKLSLDEVDGSNIVYFESENKTGQVVPVMVYVTPTGRIFAGSSMCEPCRGTKFSLAGEALVCNTCNTTYEIETHKFISGSTVCGSYPPVNMNPYIEGSNIIIDRNEIFNWEIRG